jgi:hypothetical protein
MGANKTPIEVIQMEEKCSGIDTNKPELTL